MRRTRFHGRKAWSLLYDGSLNRDVGAERKALFAFVKRYKDESHEGLKVEKDLFYGEFKTETN